MLKQRKWKRQDEQRFFETLNDLLENGYTLNRSLAVMQAMLPTFNEDLKRIQSALQEGHELSVGLKPFVRGHILDELNLIDLHGCQLDSLRSIGEREKQYQQQFKQLGAVLCYPVLLFVLLGAIGCYMGMYLFDSINDLQIQMIGFGILFCIVAMCSGIIWFSKLKKLQQYKLMLRIPLIGPIIRLAIQQALYLQLGYLLKSGVNLQAIVLYCQAHPDHWICQLIGTPVKDAWERGQALEKGLNQVLYLSEEAKQLFMRGKATPDIGYDLIQLAKHLNLRQKQRVQTVMAFVQPLCFIVIGLLVIGLYMALLLPLYQQMLDMGGI